MIAELSDSQIGPTSQDREQGRVVILTLSLPCRRWASVLSSSHSLNLRLPRLPNPACEEQEKKTKKKHPTRLLRYPAAPGKPVGRINTTTPNMWPWKSLCFKNLQDPSYPILEL